jgi:hypothetical protein
MKRLVADEGVDKAIVEALRADGFEVRLRQPIISAR